MNVKKTVLSVILGAAILSLLSAVIGGVANSLMYLIDYDISDYLYNYAVGGVELGFALIIVAFAIAIGVCKKQRTQLSIIAAIIAALYFLLTVIVLRINVEADGINSRDYSLFTSYLTAAITMAISAITAAVSYVLLVRSKSDVPVASDQDPAVDPTEQKVEAAPVAAAKKFCPQCGKEYEVGTKFCGGCGHKLS